MKILQEKLDFLLEKYSVTEPVKLNDGQVIVDKTNYPLLPWRFERRFIELKNSVSNTLGELSMIKASHICNKSSDIIKILQREVDIAEFVTDKKPLEVFAVHTKNALNANILLEDNVVFMCEIAATLNDGEQEQDKHEIISDRGIACDMVVDTQVKQKSIYVFGENAQSYTDVDFELFGLNSDETAIVRAAFALAKDVGLRKDFKEQAAYLERVVAAADKSMALLSNVRI